MKKHILVISQYFYPEEFRINDICKEWIDRGYQVTVITGIPNYPKGKFYKNHGIFKRRTENYHGIDIIRLPIVPRGSNSLMLVLNYFSFVLSGFFWQLATKIDPDLVFVFEVSPMTQALPAVWFAKKKKKPLIVYVQDLWPENVQFVTGINNKLVINPLNKMVDYIYKHTNLILTTSKSFRETIIARGVESSRVKYWPQYAEDFYIPLKNEYATEIVQDDKFNITFTGNVGVAQGLQILPKVAKLLISEGNNNFRFNIVGDGRYKSDLISLINKEVLESHFTFINRKPADKMPEYLAMSDAAYLSFEDNELFNKTIPAKLQSYLACGIPIIASASGETERIIKESGAGLSSPTGNIEQLTKNIVEMMNKNSLELNNMRKNARKYYEEEFDKNNLLDAFDEYYNETIN